MAAKNKPTSPSRDQVRAWLSTVIAPIRSGLGLELQFLARRDPSFRWYSNELEFVVCVDRLLPSIYTPNLLQFWRYHPDLKKTGNRHDASVVSLGQFCRELFGKLIDLSDFQQRAVKIEAPQHGEENFYRYLGQYTINDLKQLPEDNRYHESWKAHGTELLALRDEGPLAADFHRQREMTAAVGEIARELYSELVATQEQLADRFGLPPVDPSPASIG